MSKNKNFNIKVHIFNTNMLQVTANLDNFSKFFVKEEQDCNIKKIRLQKSFAAEHILFDDVCDLKQFKLSFFK